MKKNELLIILPDKISRALEIINTYRDKKNEVTFEQSDIPNLNGS